MAKVLPAVLAALLWVAVLPQQAPDPPSPGQGVNVGIDLMGGRTVWLSAVAVRAVAVPEQLDSMIAAAASEWLNALVEGRVTSPADPADEVTWVWVTGPEGDVASVAERRPSFFVTYANVRGLDPSTFAPQLVRLLPVAAGGHVVSLAVGRADARDRTQPDWPLRRVLGQDELRVDLDVSSPGLVRVRTRSTLPPGRYAVVLRPSTDRPYAGTQVLSSEGPGVAFGAAWPFVVQ